MDLLGDGLLDDCLLVFLLSGPLLLLDLVLDLFQVVVDVLGVVQLLRFKIPFEHRDLQSVTELYFLVFYERTLVGRTLEVVVTFDGPVVLASVLLLPLNTDPGLVGAVGRLAFVHEGPKVSDNAGRVVEEHLPSNQLLLVLEIILLQPFGLSLEVVALSLIHI